MAGIRDRDFLVACGRLASALHLSAATARQRAEYQALQEGISDRAGKLELVERMVAEATSRSGEQGERLDAQLHALESEADFLTED